ncbi:MAG: hypothetical protein AAGC67_09220 [Myxococcota bacterium]
MVVLKWAAALGFVYVVGGVGTSFLSAETVELETHDPRGGALQTSLWVVDVNGDTWIRATDPEALWFTRLRAAPDVRILRDGVRSARRAVIASGFEDRVEEAMREKYGRADELLAWLRDPDDFVAIRLDATGELDAWDRDAS